MFPTLVYLGALSLLVFVFTVLLLVAVVTLFIPNNFVFAFGVSRYSFIIVAVSFFTAVAVAVFFRSRSSTPPTKLKRCRTSRWTRSLHDLIAKTIVLYGKTRHKNPLQRSAGV